MKEEMDIKKGSLLDKILKEKKRRYNYYRMNKKRICKQQKKYYNKHKVSRLKTMRLYRQMKKSRASKQIENLYDVSIMLSSYVIQGDNIKEVNRNGGKNG